jgi:phosphoserine phosphatase RsbU/P
MDGPSFSRTEAKLLYRRLDSLFGAMDPTRPQRRLLESFLDDLFKSLKEDLRLGSAVLYGERRNRFSLMRQVGVPLLPLAKSLDPQQEYLKLLLEHRVYIYADPQSGPSPAALGALPRQPAAAILVGQPPQRFILFFLLEAGWVREELDFVLNTVRAALGTRLTEERVRGSMREAARIQRSLLMQQPPAFEGFEIACRSLPAEEVGGDFYDFVPFAREVMGFSLGDASGHGLPAALVVRDVVTGLRMGLEMDMKAGHILAKLNRVVHRSNLSSRFVSLFYGELERDGGLFYVNAGHQPPLLFGCGEPQELTIGGTVIGPLPEVRFQRGFARMEPGSALVLFTDGVIERHNHTGEMYGVERLIFAVQDAGGRSAADILDRLFQESFAFGEEGPWEDDATVLIVRRLP